MSISYVTEAIAKQSTKSKQKKEKKQFNILIVHNMCAEIERFQTDFEFSYLVLKK